jgi:geranylgeranyl pyrophosphate synthase
MATGTGPETRLHDADLASVREAVDTELAAFLDGELREAAPPVSAALRHAVLAPGKRIRPLLLVASYRAAGGEARTAGVPRSGVELLACSVELVHAYSLIHDDLPCMDDDLLRRGRPTLHVEFGVETATLAGAALMPLAIRAIAVAGARLRLEPDRVARLIRALTVAAGGSGMVGGQLRDLDAEGRAVTPEELEKIHLGKTARLIAAACVMGAVAANAPTETEQRLERFGRNLGLAFQVVDDILDVTGSSREMGKAGGRDAALGKATVPSIVGVREATRLGRELAARARTELVGLEGAGQLRAMVHLVVERKS